MKAGQRHLLDHQVIFERQQIRFEAMLLRCVGSLGVRSIGDSISDADQPMSRHRSMISMHRQLAPEEKDNVSMTFRKRPASLSGAHVSLLQVCLLYFLVVLIEFH